MTALRAEGLFKVFGRHADDAVAQLREGASVAEVRETGATPAVIDTSFAVEAGEIFVVMGLSGSGKSTLIRMLNGLLPPTAGEVWLGDENVTALRGDDLRKVRQERMSMVFQHFALLPHRTVLQNAGYALEIRGVDADERRTRAQEALEMVGLSQWADQRPGELSGGMKQRVGLARALAAGTDMLLMDEAFSALDPLIRREMQDQLMQLQAELGKTIVFITHDLNEAMRLGDRVAIMREGRIVQNSTPQTILTEPADDYVAQFLADVDRTRVLTARSVMQPMSGRTSTPANGSSAARVLADAPLVELLEPASHGRELLVVDEAGNELGTVPPTALLASLAGHDQSPNAGSTASGAPSANGGAPAGQPIDLGKGTASPARATDELTEAGRG